MRHTLILLTLCTTLLYADSPWSKNSRVSTPIAWDTLDQGESSFDVYGDSIYAVCNTAQRGQDPNDPFAYSLDNGKTFVQLPFVDEKTGIKWQTDPIIEVDDSGNIHMIVQFSTSYMNHYFSRDAGVTWEDTSRVNSSNGVDKPWWVVDKNEIYVVWQQTAGQQGIWLAKSTDYGKSFTDRQFWNRRGITGLDMDQKKRLHLVNGTWGGEVYYRRSDDKGASWTAEKKVGTHSYASSYGDRAAITSIAAHDDYVFITYVDNSANGSWEVNGIRSEDGGATWEQPFIVNDDTQGGQCKGFAHFDCYGGLHVFYYHTPDWRTNASSKFSTRCRYSSDGGKTFGPSMRISDGEWASNADFIGEYHILRSDSQYVYAVWADGRNPEGNDLYLSKAKIDDIVSIQPRPRNFVKPQGRLLALQATPNGSIKVTVQPHNKDLSISLFDVRGRKLKTLHQGSVVKPFSTIVSRRDVSTGMVLVQVKGEEIQEVEAVMLY